MVALKKWMSGSIQVAKQAGNMRPIDDTKQVGTVFNIQKYSVHDGPGIRTLVFLKGCPLRCSWCSNPESQAFNPELAYNQGKCLGQAKCTHCTSVCPENAIIFTEEGKAAIDRVLCKNCTERCVPYCPAQALIAYGEKTTVATVIDAVEQDSMFYTRSGGGLTLSGGEPLSQPVFALALLREARKRRIKTSIETCGCAPLEVMQEAAQHLNSMMFDIKHTNSEVHAAATGQGNEGIIENFLAMATMFPKLPIVVRTPVIPGVNDNEDCIAAIARLVEQARRSRPENGAAISYELLPYHRLGTQKYVFLGRESSLGDATLDNAVFARLAQLASQMTGV